LPNEDDHQPGFLPFQVMPDEMNVPGYTPDFGKNVSCHEQIKDKQGKNEFKELQTPQQGAMDSE